MTYDYTAYKRSLECLFGLGALGKIISQCRSEDLIPISASSQDPSRMMNLCARQWRCHHTPTLPTAKSDTFVHERRNIPTATVPPDENTPVIRMIRKTGLVRKRTLMHSFLLQFTCLCCPLPAVATMP
ncbi:hypothetical protein TNCV_4176951 [Trichonephila clavipes]|nr:hypothetical protein TNCV_4176951 [Trichonephila clavipes]